MTTKKVREEEPNELHFELKYCERCGGLWLRPAGGAQIYCAACARAMAELPAVSHKARGARMPVGKQWSGEDEEFDGNDDGLALDANGGAA